MLDKESTLEALLDRPILKPDTQLIDNFLGNKVVMVAGAGGSIGSALCRQIIRSRPAVLVLYEHSEPALFAVARQLRLLLLAEKHRLRLKIVPVLGSIGDPERLRQTLEDEGVDIIFHAAAYNQVDLLEKNVIAGIRNNIADTRVLAETASACCVESLVFVSTDKAKRACNVMGATKRLAEYMLQAIATQAASTRLAIVRFGNVLESSGSVMPIFQRQILAGGPVTVTHPDMRREFLTAAEAAQLIIQAGAMSDGNGIYTLALSEPLRIVDLARKLIRLMGFEECTSCAENACQCEKGIRISFIGLRDGESADVDMALPCPTLRQTSNPNIFRLDESRHDPMALKAVLGQLETACSTMDAVMARKVLEQAFRHQDDMLSSPNVATMPIGKCAVRGTPA